MHTHSILLFQKRMHTQSFETVEFVQSQRKPTQTNWCQLQPESVTLEATGYLRSLTFYSV